MEGEVRKNGILEWWSNGFRKNGAMKCWGGVFSNTPILQYSNTPFPTVS
jgi:hypothetical protein